MTQNVSFFYRFPPIFPIHLHLSYTFTHFPSCTCENSPFSPIPPHTPTTRAQGVRVLIHCCSIVQTGRRKADINASSSPLHQHADLTWKCWKTPRIIDKRAFRCYSLGMAQIRILWGRHTVQCTREGGVVWTGAGPKRGRPFSCEKSKANARKHSNTAFQYVWSISQNYPVVKKKYSSCAFFLFWLQSNQKTTLNTVVCTAQDK